MRNKSNCMLVSSVYSTVYTLVLLITGSLIFDIVDPLVTDMLSVQSCFLVIGTIFAYISTFTNKSGLALTAAILFSVSLIFLPPDLWGIIYLTPLIFIVVTAYIGWCNIKKLNLVTLHLSRECVLHVLLLRLLFYYYGFLYRCI